MGPATNTILGIAFLIVGLIATILMYHLWGYDYDKEKHQSSAPRSLMNLHRLLGYIYVGIYVVLMWQMVPRMWEYQIELPARTVVHLTLGMTIGAILVLKIMIVQFFRHLEGTLIPFLGTTLMICTVLVVFLSVPFALREQFLSRQAILGGDQTAKLERVDRLLKIAGQADDAFRSELATARGLGAGRNVLYRQCMDCHDLRTVLAKPRTPENWWSTVKRMADRSDLLNPITEQQQWQVTAYLIAITPDLQKSVSRIRKEIAKTDQAQDAVDRLSEPDQNKPKETTPGDSADKTNNNANENASNNNPAEGQSTRQALPKPVNYSATVAKFIYQRCDQCHSLDTVTNYDFGSSDDVLDILNRMVDEGFEANEKEMSFLHYYLTETLAK